VTTSNPFLEYEPRRDIQDNQPNLQHTERLREVLSLFQLVVYGDKPADRSSGSEALTEIPLPRSHSLCTQSQRSTTFKVIPNNMGLTAEKEKIRAVQETTTNFDESLRIMLSGMVSTEDLNARPQGMARDIINIDVGTLALSSTAVDISSFIATTTKGVVKFDVDVVAEITDYYIKLQCGGGIDQDPRVRNENPARGLPLKAVVTHTTLSIRVIHLCTIE
jgi:hypothetical protein